MLRSQLTVFNDSFTDFLEEVKWLLLWNFTSNFIWQLVEVEQLVNKSQSTLDVTIVFWVDLFVEVNYFAGNRSLCSLKLVSELLNLLVQLADLVVFLRITGIQTIIRALFIEINQFDLCLQFGILILFFAELWLQVIDFCVLIFNYLLITNSIIERSGILLKLSLFRLELIELHFPLSDDGCLSFGDLRKSLTLGEELLDVARAKEIIAIEFGLLSRILTDLLELFLVENWRFKRRVVVLGRLRFGSLTHNIISFFILI